MPREQRGAKLRGVDFLSGIPWGNWHTDAVEKEIEFVGGIYKKPKWDLFDPFEFSLWTNSADEFAQRLADAANSGIAIHFSRGPLGGGSFYLSGRWISRAGCMNCDTRETIADIVLGTPAQFTAKLSGPPVFAKNIERMRNSAATTA
jgi:hypothetical protein